MTADELECSKELILWFEENLPNPPTYESEWGKVGTSWFKLPVPTEMLERLQHMERLLEKYGEPVDRVESIKLKER